MVAMARRKDTVDDSQLGLEDLMRADVPPAPKKAAPAPAPKKAAPAPAPKKAALAPAPKKAAPASRVEPPAPKVYGVGEVVRLASRALEGRFRSIWVEGEVSNLRRMTSGHVFFSLKESNAQISAVMFRGDARRLKFDLKDGDAVRCRGSLRIYEAQGRFQMYVDRVEPVGLGELMLALEELKARLAAEGLFDRAKKRPLPPAPRVLGVVTSPTGAALRDIIQVAHSRGAVRIIVSPTAVQGAEAPPQIVAALERLALREEVDVAIVGRGGGSIEDLWCFNDERVARAVAAFPKPIISAVGHEVDYTLCDYAADERAATPSAASEIAVPDGRALQTKLRGARDRLFASGRRLLDQARLRLTTLQRGLGDPRPAILDARVTLDGLVARLSVGMGEELRARRRRLAAGREGVATGHPKARLTRRRAVLERLATALSTRVSTRLAERRERMTRLGERLNRAGESTAQERRGRFALVTARLGELSPLRVLSRGYAVAVDSQGRAARSWDQVQVGERIRLRLAVGELGCEVVDRSDPEPGGGDQK
jgi:exodeoxyribonuclease VII large subunit